MFFKFSEKKIYLKVMNLLEFLFNLFLLYYYVLLSISLNLILLTNISKEKIIMIEQKIVKIQALETQEIK